jgi:cell division protein FtsB
MIMNDWKTLIPFVLATGQHPPLNITRVIESLIIAAVTGAVTMWGVQQQVQVEIMALKAQNSRIEAQLTELQAGVHRLDVAQARAEARQEEARK